MLNSNNQNGQIVLISKEISYVFPFGYAFLAGYLKEKGKDAKQYFDQEKHIDHEALCNKRIQYFWNE